MLLIVTKRLNGSFASHSKNGGTVADWSVGDQEQVFRNFFIQSPFVLIRLGLVKTYWFGLIKWVTMCLSYVQNCSNVCDASLLSWTLTGWKSCACLTRPSVLDLLPMWTFSVFTVHLLTSSFAAIITTTATRSRHLTPASKRVVTSCSVWSFFWQGEDVS